MSETETVEAEIVVPEAAPVPQPPAVREKVNVSNVPMLGFGGGASFVPESLQQIVDMSQIMAKSDFAIPPKFRGNVGACLAVTMQSLRWGMDPFAVIQKAYVTKDKGGNERIAYEAQLIAAVVNVRGGFKSRPDLAFTGSGEDMQCVVTATFKGEDTVRTLTTPKIKDIGVQNSPLWKADPEQQLSYYSLRAFGRRWCPEVLLGVLAPEDVEAIGAANATDITPPRPKQSEFERAEPAKMETPVVVSSGAGPAPVAAVVHGANAVETAKPAEPAKTVETAPKQRRKKAAPEAKADPQAGSDTTSPQVIENPPTPGTEPAQEDDESPLQRGRRLLVKQNKPNDVADLRASILEELTDAGQITAWNAECDARTKAITAPK